MIEIDKLYYLQIGVQGDNQATTIEIDMTAWAKEFPDAEFHVLFKPYNSANVSPQVSTYYPTSKILRWRVNTGATAVAGVGYTEIRAQNRDTGLIKKSRIIPAVVENSVSGVSTDPPAAYEEWVTAVLNSAAAVVAAAQGKQVRFEISEATGHLMFSYTNDETVTEETEWTSVDLGPVDAWAMALDGGYTGTREEFIQYMGDIVNGAASAAASAAEAAQYTSAAVHSWLEENIDPDSGYALDRTLTEPLAAAPADMVGTLHSISKAFYTKESDNVVSFTKYSLAAASAVTGSTAELADSNQMILTCEKPAAITLRIPIGTTYYPESAFDYNVFHPNLPAGTYTFFRKVENQYTGGTNLRFRYRKESETPGNGNNFTHGETYTFEEPVEVYIALTSGSTPGIFNNTKISFAIYESEVDEERFIPRMTAKDYLLEEEFKTSIEQITENSENLFSFSRQMLNNPALDIQFINNSEIVISGTKPEEKTYRYPMGNGKFIYSKFRPNLPAGTYMVYTRSFSTAETKGALRVRYREDGGVNGTNLANGKYIFDNPVEIYVVIPSGQTEYVDYHVQWQITPGEETKDFTPGGSSAIDSIARNKIEELLYSSIPIAYESAAIAINKLRQPGDVLLLAGSDYHFHDGADEKDNLVKYAAFAKSMAADYMLELGDNIRGYAYDDDTPDYMRNCIVILNGILRSAQHQMLYVIGNHDDADLYVKDHSKDADDFISDNELRNYYIMASDPKAVKTDSLYYHVDDDRNGIRYIVLNSSDIPKINVDGEAKYYPTNMGGFRNTQINWLKDRLMDTPEGYGIVVLVHYPVTRSGEEYKNFGVVKSLIIACHYGQTYESSGAEEDFEYSVDADFTGNARKVLCVLSGHSHAFHLANLETGEEFEDDDPIVADGIPLIVQKNGEYNQSAYIISRNKIDRVILNNSDAKEIDISGI